MEEINGTPGLDQQKVLQDQIELYRREFEKVARENVALRQQMEFLMKDLTYRTIDLGFKALDNSRFFPKETMELIVNQIGAALVTTFTDPEQEKPIPTPES